MTQDLAWEHYPWPVGKDDLLAGNARRMVLEDQPATALAPPRPAGENALINKTGATNGFGAYIAFVPAKKLGLVILANHNHPTEARVAFAYEVLRLFAPEVSNR
jgi:beta-lactamase class C